MKFLLVALGLIGLAASEAPYPPSGTKPLGPLLVLPPRQQYTAFEASSRDIQVVPSVSLDRLGEIITERLRQADGSQNGNYYVSLPDGRFQNLRYTSAPLKRPFQNTQQFNFQNSQSFGSASTSQVNLQNSQSGRFQGYTEARPKGEFEESRQSGQQQQALGNRFEQQGYSPAQDSGEGAASDQHPERVPSQKQAKPQKAEPNQPEASQDDPAVVQPQQQKQLQQSQQQLLLQAQIQDQQQLLQQAQLQDQQQWTPGYFASVQYTDIQPIAAPIYSYLPAPLVRILRYAPKY